MKLKGMNPVVLIISSADVLPVRVTRALHVFISRFKMT